MEHSSFFLPWFLVYMLHGTFILCMNSSLQYARTPTSGNESDRLALLDFKSRITEDPLQIMSSWNDSLHFCNWVGVTCSPSNGRVMILNLEGKKLAGSIPPSTGNLTFLTGLNLQNNSFRGEIPQDLGHLLLLQHLNLSSNSFGGMIPTNLTHCTDLRVVLLYQNELVGPIPDQLSSLSKLLILHLGANNLTGKIPAWIGNFSSLWALSLTRNNLLGSIPHELGGLSHLGFFVLYGNQLSGMVPPSIYNISSIYYFSITQNHLHGQLPPDVGLTLPNLQIFAGGVNNFKGTIPVSISNASGLQVLDFAENYLTGALPARLGRLKALYWLNFDDNGLGNGKNGELNFINSLGNCTGLIKLGLSRNHFGGEVPSSIANLSTQLKKIHMGSNLIHGSIPVGIGNLVDLIDLEMEENLLTGSIPDAIGKLRKLEGLYLNGNNFSGPIPSSFGNLTTLTRLSMGENRLEGIIPPSLGSCHQLLILNLSRNNLNGTIPKEVTGLSSLSISLDISHNSLTGPLPSEVDNLKNLMELDVSNNNLSGEIPSSLAGCASLERLNMAHNIFVGTIPQSLRTLRGLQEIDLSHNNLSGQIPSFLGKLILKNLNLSFNDFAGEVPREGIFTNASAISILGNANLCGGVLELHLPECSREKTHSSRKFLAPRVLIPVMTAIILVIIMLCSLTSFYIAKNSRKRPSTASSSKEWKLGVSYSELMKSTNGFSMDNLIGAGSFGSVYKGLKEDGTVVAVKVLNLQQEGASKSFIDECKALKSIRHRNLLKIITACSSVDLEGNDFKALVFQFMSNGSLDQWMHPREDEQHQTKRLNIIQRLNIAIDVASALDYLHHHCQTPIAHCDLKPSNVLLDEDMTAHVGDFGLAKFLLEVSSSSSFPSTMSIQLKGSIGYIPPEYGTGGQVSILGDVYSYGILLLEMFTGRRPTDDIFQDGLSIHKFVATALPDHVMDIADPTLLLGEEDGNEDENKQVAKEKEIINEEDTQTSASIKAEECLIAVMRVGLSCSNTESRERMTMEDVVNKMHGIRESFLGNRRRRRRTR